MFASKPCLTYDFVAQQPFGISSRNLDIYIFTISTMGILNHIAIYGKNEMSLYVSGVVPFLHLVCCHARSMGHCCPAKHDNTVTVQWQWSTLADWVSRITVGGCPLPGTVTDVHSLILGVNAAFSALWQMLHRSICIEKYCTYYVKY